MSTWLLLLAPAARAFAPTEPAPFSAVPDPVEPHRVRYQNPAEQGRLLASPAWQRWVRTDGVGWQARFDEATGTPRYLWGRGIPMPSAQDALVAELVSLLDAHADLFGHEPGTLALRSANYAADVDTWYVDLDVLRAGLPTFRGGISARVKHGNLILLTVGTAPRASVVGGIVISSDDAVLRAITQGPAPLAQHREASAEPVLLEQKSGEAFELRAAWLVRTRTAEPPGRWVSFVDGVTGRLLGWYNEVRYASGTVKGQHHERTLDGSPLVIDEMPYILVGSDGSYVNADDHGDYTVGGNGPYESILEGDYVTVRNDSGGEGYLSDGSPDLLWTSGDATQAEIDTYVFLHDVKAWGELYASNLEWVTGDVTATVNIGQTCNAYWDGEVHFFSSGGGCNNTGQIADVVYHEWGHGFHYWSILSGDFDGSLSEGAADTVAFLQTLDSEVGPYFFTNGGPVRDVGPNQVYPQDYVNNDYYVHDNGLIFGGSMWDLLNILTDEEGLSAGVASTSAIHAGLLKGGSDIPGSFYEALVADDDDGDLANGTPHVCELFDAFGKHGLGTANGVDAVIVSHDPVASAEPERDAPVSVELVSVASGCDSVGADSAAVHYRVDGGDWDQESLSTSGTAVDGEIPGQPDGSIVEYYVNGESDDGTPFGSPAGERINPYSYYVGDTLEIRCDTFDEDNGDYEVTAGSEWDRGVPAGLGGDPSGAWSGTKIWGIDLVGDGEYEKNSTETLTGPWVDTKHYTGVFLQYRRWLMVEDSTYDQASIDVNEIQVWENWKGSEGHDSHLDGQWVNHVVDLQGIADQTEAKLEFSLKTDGGLQFGGWNIDDVCLLAPATPDNRLGITDFHITITGDTRVRLQWTNSAHAPLERVRVVRRMDRFPESPDDGDVAEEIDDPEVLAAMDVEDVNGHPGTSYYAVYGYDGQDWLSWTVDGWNAASVDLVGGEVPVEDQFDTGGSDYRSLGGCMCSASSAGSPAGGALVLLGLAISVRRRRA